LQTRKVGAFIGFGVSMMSVMGADPIPASAPYAREGHCASFAPRWYTHLTNPSYEPSWPTPDWKAYDDDEPSYAAFSRSISVAAGVAREAAPWAAALGGGGGAAFVRARVPGDVCTA